MCHAGFPVIYSVSADQFLSELPLISHEALGQAPGGQPDSQLSVKTILKGYFRRRELTAHAFPCCYGNS